MQLLLSCLNFLRGQYLDAMVAFTTRAEARQGGKGGGRGRGAAAAAAAEGRALTLDDIALWSKVVGGWPVLFCLAAGVWTCSARVATLLGPALAVHALFLMALHSHLLVLPLPQCTCFE